ncbi:MAG: hypothetical protein IJA41_08510, partial [Clostridia bacterium]|nr:hypothetical protein [Clostridia bacterium]
FSAFTKLRSTLKRKILVAEKKKPPDNADAYRVALTLYDAKFSLFKETLPYAAWALNLRFFVTVI